jgi:hypothetical protein
MMSWSQKVQIEDDWAGLANHCFWEDNCNQDNAAVAVMVKILKGTRLLGTVYFALITMIPQFQTWQRCYFMHLCLHMQEERQILGTKSAQLLLKYLPSLQQIRSRSVWQ